MRFLEGARSLEEHRLNGANLEIDVPFQYLTFFMEDDERLEEIRVKYGSGEMMTKEIKADTIKIVTDFVLEHQRRRSLVTDEIIQEFMRPRSLLVNNL
jgi:Tryptophanyl-tRNA synthetase